MVLGNNLDVNNNQLLNAKFQILASDPGSPAESQFWYNSTSRAFKYRTNSATITLGDLTSFLTASSSAALTNKTFDANGTGNSISNLEVADFMAGVIETILSGGTTNIPRSDAVKTYVDNAVQGLKWKDAVRAATAAAGTLASSFANGQVIDGITLATGDRILIKDQAAGAENGIYTVNASGAPTRATDADVNTEVWNMTCAVLLGTANAGLIFKNNNSTLPTLGSTALTFIQLGGGTVPDASTSTKGKVQLATQAEAEAKSDSAKAVVPSDLVNFPIKKAFDVGDGSATSYVLTHNLNTRDVIVEVYYKSSTYDKILVDVQMTTVNTVTIIFSVAPTSAQFRAVVIG